MRFFFRNLFTAMVVTSAFVIGFQIGRDKERRKIPEFQED
jgi:hypothetical protein